MTELIWDATGERTYETGVDHGVLYIPNESGVYTNGVAWNGLINVTASPSGAEANPQYADNMKYLNLTSAEDFSGTIEAFTYPDEFAPFDGLASPVRGLYVGQQRRGTFGFSYRTRLGNDLLGDDYGYKIHLVYGCTAAPSERAYGTVNESPEAMTLSWEISTVAGPAAPGLRPAATISIVSTEVDDADLAAFEAILYGTPGTDPRLPTIEEVIAAFGSGGLTVVATVKPTINTFTNVITIPSVTGVNYYIDGDLLEVGPQAPITDDVLVTAIPAVGYAFTPTSEDDWAFEHTP